jgi:hypothetical protein
VEAVRVGEVVLAQHVETGDLLPQRDPLHHLS